MTNKVSPFLSQAHYSSQIVKNSLLEEANTKESPSFEKNLLRISQEEEERRNSLRNLTKKIKLHKENDKTVKKVNILKKGIKKNAKLALKNLKHNIIEVSGSTLPSNATPKLIPQEDLIEEIADFSFETSQNAINSCFIDGTLNKYKADEVKFISFFLRK